MGLKADFRQIDNLIKAAKTLQDPKFFVTLNKNLGQEALEQVDRGFAEGVDPYGKRWKKSYRAKRQSGQTLRDTRRLNNSFSRQGVKADRRGFEIGTSVVYAGAHQDGATIRPKRKKALKFKIGDRWVSKKEVKLPQRQMVPEGDLGKWAEPLEDIAALVIERSLG